MDFSDDASTILFDRTDESQDGTTSTRATSTTPAASFSTLFSGQNSRRGTAVIDDCGRGSHGNGVQKFRKRSSTTTATTLQLHLACPFVKNQPFKYGKQKSCLRSWPAVARLKEHLYRDHECLPQCPRCGQHFYDEDELATHLRAPEACVPCNIGHAGGISPEQKRKLKSRQYPSKMKTEEEKWKYVYMILFPQEEEIPSPYLEVGIRSEAELLKRYKRDLSDHLIDALSREILCGSLGLGSTKPLVDVVHSSIDGIIRKAEAGSPALVHGLTPVSKQFSPLPCTMPDRSDFSPSETDSSMAQSPDFSLRLDHGLYGFPGLDSQFENASVQNSVFVFPDTKANMTSNDHFYGINEGFDPVRAIEPTNCFYDSTTATSSDIQPECSTTLNASTLWPAPQYMPSYGCSIEKRMPS